MVAAGGIKVGVMLGWEVFAYWPCIHCKLPQIRINNHGGGKRINTCHTRNTIWGRGEGEKIAVSYKSFVPSTLHVSLSLSHTHIYVHTRRH